MPFRFLIPVLDPFYSNFLILSNTDMHDTAEKGSRFFFSCCDELTRFAVIQNAFLDHSSLLNYEASMVF